MKKLIKHFIDRAKDFEYEEPNDDEPIISHLPSRDFWAVSTVIKDKYQSWVIPLFIYRAIDGINSSESAEIVVTQMFIKASIGYLSNGFRVDKDNPMQAKIEALQWIMEQEEEAK